MKPLAIDLFCGLGGWTEGLLAEGYRVIGFDIERHAYGDEKYPAQLVIQDVLTVHGKQIKNADLIVASPPCTEFSYMAMPWSRGKQIEAAMRGQGEFPEGYRGSRTVAELTALFDACFRIQREASAAAGRHIPMVVENVRGAQPWVGRARANYGSFYLWGDVPALMPTVYKARKVPGFRFDGSGRSFQTASVHESGVKVPTMGASWYPPGHPKHVKGLAFNTLAERATKNQGGSWFNVAHNTTSGKGQNPVHRQISEGRRAKKYDQTDKQPGIGGIKQPGIGGIRKNGKGDAWFQDGAARHGSKSSARKAASARIAKIPVTLGRHIARTYRPERAA